MTALYQEPLSGTTIRNHYPEPIPGTNTRNHYPEPIPGTNTRNHYPEPIRGTTTRNQYATYPLASRARRRRHANCSCTNHRLNFFTAVKFVFARGIPTWGIAWALHVCSRYGRHAPDTSTKTVPKTYITMHLLKEVHDHMCFWESILNS